VAKVLSFLVGALVAVGLVSAGLEAIQPLHGWPFTRGLLAVGVIVISAGVPAWLVGRLHPILLPVHILAYFASLLALFVVMALVNMQTEL
jgi:hypothetical protein